MSAKTGQGHQLVCGAQIMCDTLPPDVHLSVPRSIPSLISARKLFFVQSVINSAVSLCVYSYDPAVFHSAVEFLYSDQQQQHLQDSQQLLLAVQLKFMNTEESSDMETSHNTASVPTIFCILKFHCIAEQPINDCCPIVSLKTIAQIRQILQRHVTSTEGNHVHPLQCNALLRA